MLYPQMTRINTNNTTDINTEVIPVEQRRRARDEPVYRRADDTMHTIDNKVEHVT